MKKLFLSILGITTIAVVWTGYHFVVDGTLPATSSYQTDIEHWRELARASDADRPSGIQFEIVGKSDVPGFAVQAGSLRGSVSMVRSVFRLQSDWGDTLIDVGMDAYVAETFNSRDTFYPDPFERVKQVMGDVRRIVVTHEHPDHLGYLPRHAALDDITDALRLNSAQIDASALYTDDMRVPAALAQLTPQPADAASVIAPGVVMIPAPGHTPGSVMFFVSMRDNREVLFVGDIVWNMSNLVDAQGRPRLVQQYLMPQREDRRAVYDQVVALITIMTENKNLTVLPSHDEAHLARLVADGLLSETFSN
ncbi:MBL fold metallo-hydrolase [Pyruvatibacter sp.]|uniref:MBL fold metallo-hydrolase n=1 Tax=Pyruvatibacter sp. TaxID=1981328 RepID=UPI00326384C1